MVRMKRYTAVDIQRSPAQHPRVPLAGEGEGPGQGQEVILFQ